MSQPTHPGEVVSTAGRRVIVRDDEGERVCFLSGQRAVVGDIVRWVDAPGEGGKLVGVEPRRTALVRTDDRGREQVLAANLDAVFVVCSPVEPAFRAGLLDRYLVAASVCGISAEFVLNKVDQGVPDEVMAELALREAAGVSVHHVSATTGVGIEDLAARVATFDNAVALVGHSGTGKTSLVAALLPGEDVGEIGHLSAYWGQGRHTTTHSRLFTLPGGGRLVDSPGIRTFAPGKLEAQAVRDHFPGFVGIACRYRDCLHREGEEGCVTEAEVPAALLASYRRLLTEITRIDAARSPGGKHRNKPGRDKVGR